MTDQHVEQWLWHAIMRETSQRSRLRKRLSREVSIQSNKKKQKNSHQQPMPPAAMEQRLEDTAAADQQQELPLFIEQQPEPTANNGPPSDTRSGSNLDPGEAFFSMLPLEAADNDENQLSSRDQLMQTKNNENPYDLGTSYGKYATITAILKHYSDITRLQRAVEQPLDPGIDTAQLGDAYNKWSDEFDSMVADRATLELTPTPENQKKDIEQSEKLLNNTDYQPMNYMEACNALNIDPERPQLRGIKLTYEFQAWQVTGIYRMIRKGVQGCASRRCNWFREDPWNSWLLVLCKFCQRIPQLVLKYTANRAL
jgi:hypothetical protein